MSIELLNDELLIEDQALRDGHQMESRIFPIELKLQLFQMLKAAGVRRIQVGSFVHPKIVHQMADTDDLVRAIPEEAGIRVFDTCVGGLGGCPFVKGAAGNIPPPRMRSICLRPWECRRGLI